MTTSRSFTASLRTASLGLVLAVLTLLFSQGIGIVFGLNEDAIKSRFKTSAAAVRDTVYKGDDAAIKAVLDKSWGYMQRAHLHGGGMGTTALALIVLVGLIGASRLVTTAVSLGLGAGGLGYSIFWMWAGFCAPALGSTGLAKESLKWLAMPSSGDRPPRRLPRPAAILPVLRRVAQAAGASGRFGQGAAEWVAPETLSRKQAITAGCPRIKKGSAKEMMTSNISHGVIARSSGPLADSGGSPRIQRAITFSACH